MAAIWVSASLVSTNPSSKLLSPSFKTNKFLISCNPILTTKLLPKLQAGGLTDIEPDLNEDPRDRWATNGIPQVCHFILLSISSFFFNFVRDRLEDFVCLSLI